MAVTTKPLDDLFYDMLKDVHYAVSRSEGLPKMAKATKSPELKKAFETHKAETAEQIERLVTSVSDQRITIRKSIRLTPDSPNPD